MNKSSCSTSFWIVSKIRLDVLAREVIRPALEAEKIPWYGGHAFRRGMATNLHRLGVSDKVIQQILRHANVTTTINIYVKMVTQDAEDAMRKLETKCALVVPQTVPQLPSEGTQLGTKNGVITVQQVQPLEAVRDNLSERGGLYCDFFRNSIVFCHFVCKTSIFCRLGPSLSSLFCLSGALQPLLWTSQVPTKSKTRNKPG